MASPQLTQGILLARLEELPSLPKIVYELSQVINDPMSSTSDVEKIMANDLSLTAKVLQLVNSAYYAIPGGVSSLARAIGYIGFDTVNQLVLSASILKALEHKGPQRFDMNEFWKHSIGTGIASETIAKYVKHPTPADLFTCGLVHDMGKVALYSIEAELMLNVVAQAKKLHISYVDAETAVGVPAHTVIGQVLAARWALPPSIQAVVRYHHDKEHTDREELTSDVNRNVDIVLLANLLTHALKFGNSGHTLVLGAPRDVMERLALHPDKDLKPLLLEIKAGLDKAEDFLRVLAGGA
jgi:HD-like signal output (HDOD) protein